VIKEGMITKKLRPKNYGKVTYFFFSENYIKIKKTTNALLFY